MSFQFPTVAARRISSVWVAMRPIAFQAIGWLAENTPIVGLRSSRRRRRVILAPYKRTNSLTRIFLVSLAFPILSFLCLLYGFFFALTAPHLLVPFAIPIAILTALVIWALPDQRSAPTSMIEFLLPAYFVTLVLWPRYLAISLPGMPWINIQRIIGFPMGLLLVISLSVSKKFRSKIIRTASSVPMIWKFFTLFLFLEMVTIAVSSSPLSSAQIVFDQQIYWTSTFLISCIMFRKIEMIERYWGLLCALAFFIVFVTAVEWHQKHILWVGHIPKILRVPDASVQLALQSEFRPGTNAYRAKATFSTPLGLSEFLSLLTPFFLHFGFSRINPMLKAACWVMIPVLFVAIRMTDARLGLVGMLVSILLYGLLWTIVRWRSHPRDLFAAATVYAYPAIFLLGIGLVLASHRMKLMVFGGGAQASSTEARQTQLGMAMSKVWTHPWGFGAGQSGNAMGYAKDAFITVDNYFISLVLDYGLLGVIAWYGMFIAAIVVAVRYCISPDYGHRVEARLLAPIAVSLTAFLIVKWVHGQSDNHAIFFMLLGMVCALVYRLRNTAAEPSSSQSPQAAVLDRRPWAIRTNGPEIPAYARATSASI